MAVVEKRKVISGITVGEAMRRQVISLPISADIGQAIRMMIRNKTNAVLLLTDQSVPFGVVSKTDLMGAFYAEFPAETPLGDVVGNQPIACFSDDPLEDAIELMEAAGVHQLYIIGASRDVVIGVVTYSDIVGLLYRYCRDCEWGTTKKRIKHSKFDPSVRLKVKEVMTQNVFTCLEKDQLFTIIETLSTNHMGAVLVQNETHSSVGVISKTNLILAYHHGVTPETQARVIMNTPVHSVQAEQFLSIAIEQMLIKDVQRLFVHRDASNPDIICGVLALSDAARFRSGSCRACAPGRMLT